MVSGTIEPMGTTLAGQDIEAFYISLEHMKPISVGLNCATGPEFMTDHIRTLSSISKSAVAAIQTLVSLMKKDNITNPLLRLLKKSPLLQKKAG